MRALSFLGLPVHPPASQLALLDPQLRCHLGIVATHLLDEPLRVLAPNQHLELDAEEEIGSNIFPLQRTSGGGLLVGLASPACRVPFSSPSRSPRRASSSAGSFATTVSTSSVPRGAARRSSSRRPSVPPSSCSPNSTSACGFGAASPGGRGTGTFRSSCLPQDRTPSSACERSSGAPTTSSVTRTRTTSSSRAFAR